MTDFFRDKLAHIYALNTSWIKSFLTDEDLDLPVELKKIISETINFTYLWICSRKNITPDLELYDLLPEYSWIELELDNGREIDAICDLEKDVDPAFLYPILFGSISNLGKIEYLARKLDLSFPNQDLVKVIL